MQISESGLARVRSNSNQSEFESDSSSSSHVRLQSHRRNARPSPENIDARPGIPPNAQWTKIDRRLVNPQALEEAHEIFEERPDYVIVLRVMTRDEIEVYAARTWEIRGM